MLKIFKIVLLGNIFWLFSFISTGDIKKKSAEQEAMLSTHAPQAVFLNHQFLKHF